MSRDECAAATTEGEAVLTKQAIVLERFARHDDGGIVFRRPFDEDMPEAYRESVKLAPEAWTEMGEPDTLTLTVEVGDSLNG